MKIVNLLFCFTCVMAFSAFSNSIAFKKPINRLNAPVMLVDIVELQNLQHFASLKWPNNLKGWVSQSQVDEWLKTDPEVDETEHEWQGLNRVWVELCYKPRLQDIQMATDNQARNLLQSVGLKLVSLATLLDTDLPCAAQQVSDFKLSNFNIKNGDYLSLIVELKMIDGQQLTKELSIKFNALVTALSLTADAVQYSQLETLSFRTEDVLWTGHELNHATNLKGLRLKKSLLANSVLKQDYVELTPDVSRGKNVLIKVSNGAVKITTKGVAVTSGNLGQTIKVRVEGSQMISEAIVVAKGEVNVSV